MLWCIFIADKLIDRVRTQQRLLHLVHLYGLRRVDYMRWCILVLLLHLHQSICLEWIEWIICIGAYIACCFLLLGMEKKRKVGAAGWCIWS